MLLVTSRDGTPIAYERTGHGPPLVLVAGTLGTRRELQELASVLAGHFSVFNYDRRGRGDSGDVQPYAIEREIDDVEAVVDAAGGTAYVYGGSSGAILALDAANHLPAKIQMLALYEPPFLVDASRPPLARDYVERLEACIAAGKRGEAVTLLFRELMRLPNDVIEEVRHGNDWAHLESLAHTIAYDGRIICDMLTDPPPIRRWPTATMPVLVMNGSASEAQYVSGTPVLADVLPNARHTTLEGQEHSVASEAIAPVLVSFFLHV